MKEAVELFGGLKIPKDAQICAALSFDLGDVPKNDAHGTVQTRPSVRYHR